jgi:hypothetical protein
VKRRRWLWIAAVPLAIAAGLFGVSAWRHYAFRREIAALVAELDTSDSRWRIEDIEKERATVPDAENSALRLERLGKALMAVAGLFDDFMARAEFPTALTPNVRLTDRQYRICVNVLEAEEAVVTPAARLADFPRGRKAIQYGADGYGALMPMRDAGLVDEIVFRFLLPLHVNEAKLPSAARDCVALLNLAGSIGDYPPLSAQHQRAIMAARAAGALEYVLGHGELPPATLADLQDHFAAEADHPYWRIGLRGDRAEEFRFLEALADGRASMDRLRSYGFTARLDAVRNWIEDRIGPDPKPEIVARIRLETRLLVIADRPLHVTAGMAAADPLAGRYPLNILRPMQQSIGRLRAAVTAVAAERYRLAHGRWPGSLSDLTPNLLPSVPLDPFDGDPLRYRRLPDGIAVGRVGATDDAPAFRLWDVAARNQPAPEDAP